MRVPLAKRRVDIAERTYREFSAVHPFPHAKVPKRLEPHHRRDRAPPLGPHAPPRGGLPPAFVSIAVTLSLCGSLPLGRESFVSVGPW